ncbi:DNA glycosylase [Leucosporidium creatinivorum]|uniref:Endonuclease III homolog n=1 Tax=Leucosporidium creatinivorum TaxID=106004 RepID=A0A1Y2F539_9BASI|nr:DNA glycosylase [Leucosporidium creatinivorum]
MAPRARRSEFNSRVTIYEPAAAGAVDPASATSPSTTPLKRTRVTRSTASSPAAGSSTAATAKEEDEEDEKKPVKVAKKATTPRKPKPFQEKLDKAHPEPKRWREQYEAIRKQRETIVAPVDTMGCEQGGRDRDEAPTNEKDNRLSILVSLMLSSQTKDPVTHQATMNLRQGLRGGLSLEGLLNATVDEIDALICKVGFHATKAANLAKLAVRLRDLHDGDVPSDLPSLLAINGVGPKMSILYLQAIGINAGIGVDTHVHRISNRLGWHKPATNTPEQTRLNLESWLPKELHPKINLMLVGFGQKICLPVGPRCDLCSLASASPLLCPSAKKVAPRKEKLKKEQSPKIEIEIEGEIKPSVEDTPSAAEMVQAVQKVEVEVKEEEGGSVVVKEEQVLSSVKAEVASPVKHRLGW